MATVRVLASSLTALAGPTVALFACLSLYPFAAAAEEVEVTAEVAKMIADVGGSNEFFGTAVSLDGDRLAVGADRADIKFFGEGAAYVFERDTDGSWLQTARLVADDGFNSDEFGATVSLDGDRIAVGAWGDDDNGSASGAAYVFERGVDGTWSQVAKLVPLDGQLGDAFGLEVSLDGDRLAIGAYNDDDNGSDSGSVYVFERDAEGRWLEAAKLLALDGEAFDSFGFRLSLDRDRLAIGALFEDESAPQGGAVYLFERAADGEWVQTSKLLASDPQDFHYFGYSLSLDRDRLAVGAQQDEDIGDDAGATYVFERTADGTWFRADKIIALDGQAEDLFGSSVSLDGERLVIAAWGGDDSGSGSGSVYLFERSVDGDWLETDKLRTLDGRTGDVLGASVSLDGDRLAAGATGDDDNGPDSGSAYLFEAVLVSPQLTLEGTCPGEVQLTSSGTTPRSGVRLYRSMSLGTLTFESGPCAGATLDLESPTVMGEGNTDFDAESIRRRTVDESHCGLYLQAVDSKTCLTSGVVQVP